MAVRILTEKIGVSSSGGFSGTLNLRGAHRISMRADNTMDFFINESQYGFTGKTGATFVLVDSSNPDHGFLGTLPYTGRCLNGAGFITVSFEIKIP